MKLSPSRCAVALAAATTIAVASFAASTVSAAPTSSHIVDGPGFTCTISAAGDTSAASCDIYGDDHGLVDLHDIVRSLQAAGVDVDEYTPMVVEATGGSGGAFGSWMPGRQGAAVTASTVAAVDEAVDGDGTYQVHIGQAGTTGHSGAGGSSTLMVANTPGDPALDDVVVLAAGGGGTAGRNSSGVRNGGDGGVVSPGSNALCGDGDHRCAAGNGPGNIPFLGGGGDPFTAGSHEVGGFGGGVPGNTDPVTFQNPSPSTWAHGNGRNGHQQTVGCGGLGPHWFELTGHSGGGGGGFPGGAGGNVSLSCPNTILATGGGGGGSAALAPTESFGDYAVTEPSDASDGSLTITFQTS